ncbi:MAG: ATP-dependent RNA helicase HrpA [Actinobacteria bacterium]|nr:ATP-dependent RNA helicase HrpA [Actinomycetota bacterium]
MSELKIAYPEDLPVSLRRQDILDAITNNQVVVIAGATGSGKTTQLPKMCLELGRKRIAHTQPRRIAARSVAERIAEELGVNLGDLVGYQVRFTDKASDKTQVKVMTDGILLNAIQQDPLLRRYDTVIIDEAHERSLNIDFLLGYLKKLLPKRPDLKLIITSATIDPESFSKHFFDAPIIEVSGRTFPIEIRYRPVAREQSEEDVDASSSASDYLDGLISALDELAKEPEGDTLVFLSGESEIKDAMDAIQGRIVSGAISDKTEVLPLYGRLSAQEQHRVFEPSSKAGVRRRIILATNVAETSLTIPNIKYVIDAGTARISRYSPRAKVQRLPIEAISQASANQRAGRAGRTSPGVVIRLYSEEDYNSRSEFTDPEILRTNLAAVILQAAALGITDITDFPFLQPPDSRGVRDGLGLLVELGAIANPKEVVLTQIGQKLARLPIEPRFARMLLEAQNKNLVREVMVIVSGLTIQDPRERPAEKRVQADTQHARFLDPTSDFLTLLNLYNYLEDQQKKLSSSAFRRLCKSEYLNYLRVREWQDLMRQLQSLAKPLGMEIRGRRKDPDGIHQCLLAGLLSQIGIRQEQKPIWQNGKSKPNRGPAEYAGSGGKKFYIFPGSALAKKPPQAIISAELVETSRLFARMNAEIKPEWAEELAGELCKRSFSEPHWEKKQGAVVANERVMLFGIAIVENRKLQYSRIDPLVSRELFIRHALVYGEWDSPQKFEKRNQDFLAELEQRAERSRKPELVPSENELFRFFNNRIPLDVFSTRSFEGWWRKVREQTPDLLDLSVEKLYEKQVEEPSEFDLPKSFPYEGQSFELNYKFDPGAIDDGVTVDVPLAVLARLSSDPFEWLVPGMRQDLVTELIRSLPKQLRKFVVPANDWARKVLEVLPEVPNGQLLELIAKVLRELSNVPIQASDFDTSKLPTALRMTYRVVDAKGKELGLSTDLFELKTKFQDRARGEVATLVQGANQLERKLETWDFDELPSSIESQHAGSNLRAFPTLLSGPKGVEIKLFATESERIKHHIYGVISLVRASIKNPAEYVKDHLKPDEKLALSSLGYQSVKDYLADLLGAMAEAEIRSIESSGLVLKRSEFESVRAFVEANLIERSFDVMPTMVKISQAAANAQKEISAVKNFEYLSVLNEEKSHISQLVPKNLIAATSLARLRRLPIYLEAIGVRIRKLSEPQNKDAALWFEIAEALRQYSAKGGELPLAAGSSPDLIQARWLIEEFRVGQFAQSLGTAEPASLKRIQKLLSP